MNYRSLLIGLLGIGVIGLLSFIASTVEVVHSIKPVAVYPVRMRIAGPHGVVKTCYIESDTSITYGKLIARRNYSGLSISKLLVPKGDINRLRKATFYQYHDQLQLAASAGDTPAGTVRLSLDILSYQVDRYLFFILGYALLLAFSKELYKRTFHKTVDEAEEAQLLDHTLLGKIYLRTIVCLLVLIAIV